MTATTKTTAMHTTAAVQATMADAGFMQARSTMQTTSKRTWLATYTAITATPFAGNTSKMV